MDLAWLMQPFADPPVAILAVLPWVAALLTVAVLLLWVLAAGYGFRECRCRRPKLTGGYPAKT